MVKHLSIFQDFLNTFGKEYMRRKTSIICSISSQNNSKPFLQKLIENGMDIARLNFSHGTHSEHAVTIENLRSILEENETKWPLQIATLQDIRGPKIRIGMYGDKRGYVYQAGDIIKIEMCEETIINSKQGTKDHIYCDYVDFPSSIKIGGKVFLDDGFLQTICVGKTQNTVDGVLIPGEKISLPAITDKDIVDLGFSIRYGVDFLAASFVRTSQHILDIKSHLGIEGQNIKIIAKIENQEGLDNIDSIIREADGIMVARGDLGTELPPEKIFAAQKMIIRKCNLAAKPVITATQMLESMTYNPLPTRAECTDVANAIIDGTDAVMLSGETAKGKYPDITVNTMSRICIEAELHLDSDNHFEKMTQNVFWDGTKKSTGLPKSNPEVIASNAVKIAHQTGAKLIMIFSNNGDGLKYVAKFRPNTPILLITNDLKNARQSQIIRGTRVYVTQEQKLVSNHQVLKVLEDAYKFACETGIIHEIDLQKSNLAVCLYDSSPLDYHDDLNILKLLHFKY